MLNHLLFRRTNPGQSWHFQLSESRFGLRIVRADPGLEREIRQKSAGLCATDTLVGVSSALIVLVSKYHGFTDVLENGRASSSTPSPVAAQIVSRELGSLAAALSSSGRPCARAHNSVDRLGLTAAIGMAAGAGLLILAIAC